MMSRTIDKLRASLPGGNIGDYHISGFSERVLKAIGVSEDQLREVVQNAQDDQDVAEWLRAHADARKYPEINEELEAVDYAKITDPQRRERLLGLYPLLGRETGPKKLLDAIKLDDQEAFSRKHSSTTSP